MAQVKVKDVCCTVKDGVEYCHGVLDLSEGEALELVMRLSMELESADFDAKCFEYFSEITDNCCANKCCEVKR